MGPPWPFSPTLIKQEFSTMTNMQYIGSSAFTKRIRKIRLTGFKRQKVIFCPYYRGKNFLKTRTLDSWGLPLGHRSNKRKIMKTYSQHSHYSVAIFQLLQSIPVLQQSLSSLYTKIRLTLVWRSKGNFGLHENFLDTSVPDKFIPVTRTRHSLQFC